MARTYAGTLGLVAFTTSLACGVIHGGQAESVVWTAWLWLLGFSALGWVLGWIAARTVDEAVTYRAVAGLASQERAEPTPEQSSQSGPS